MSNSPMPRGTALIIVDGLGLSGKTKAAASLALGLDPERYRAVFCCFREEDSPLAARLREGGVPIHEIPCEDGLNARVTLRLSRLMDEVRPDVVHCYNPRPMLYGGLAAQLAGISATVGSLSAFACQVPDREYGFLPQPLFTTSRKNQLRNQFAARLMRSLVSVSRSLGERFCRYNDVPLGKLRVACYGASTAEMARFGAEEARALRAELAISDDHVLVGSVGRLVEQKDYPTQLRALALALREAPNLRMVLVGDGPLRGELERLSAELGLSQRHAVRFVGHQERVPLFLRSLDVFVLASKFEPFGVALLEAKAAALPIVATRVNEVPEIVGEAHGGLLVPKEDPESMAEAFVRLAREPALRRRFGQQARADAEQRYSLGSMVRTYEGLYDLARQASAGESPWRPGRLGARAASRVRQALTASPGA